VLLRGGDDRMRQARGWRSRHGDGQRERRGAE
jgi:hypothetical protein